MSAGSTGSGTSLRIRSTAIAVASSGGPKTSRFSAWPARPSGVSGVSETSVVSIGGSRPPRPRDGHQPGEQGRADLAGLGVLAQGRVGRQHLPPHLRVSGYPVLLPPDLAQGGELTLVKRRNQRVGPRRTRMVLTVGRRALPASVLPRLSRSRPPAMSRTAATGSALAVLLQSAGRRAFALPAGDRW